MSHTTSWCPDRCGTFVNSTKRLQPVDLSPPQFEIGTSTPGPRSRVLVDPGREVLPRRNWTIGGDVCGRDDGVPL